jgi:aspartyl-tRNA synthetase
MGKKLSKADIDALQVEAKLAGSQQGLLLIKTDKWKVPKSMAVMGSDKMKTSIADLLKAAGEGTIGEDDLILMCGGTWKTVCTTLGRARLSMARIMQEKQVLTISADALCMFWVVDFPLFDVQIPSTADVPLVIESMHHPFTAANVDDKEKLDFLLQRAKLSRSSSSSSQQSCLSLTTSEIETVSSIRGQHFDLVANGLELGGGSIRIHNAQTQSDVLRTLGSDPSIFNHLLDALRFGCPPHGGLALGFDRIVAILASTNAVPLKLKDVIAFPKTAHGSDLTVAAPSEVPLDKLQEYSIQISKIKAT